MKVSEHLKYCAMGFSPRRVAYPVAALGFVGIPLQFADDWRVGAAAVRFGVLVGEAESGGLHLWRSQSTPTQRITPGFASSPKPYGLDRCPGTPVLSSEPDGVISSTMKFEFTAIVEAAPEGGYWAVCPEVPGANGQGETVDDAKLSLRDGIRLILEDRLEDMCRGLPAEAIQTVVTSG